MTTKKLQRIEWVDPSTLKKNDWNTNVVSPDNEAKIEEAIDRFGYFKPILVRTLPNGTKEILGGEHRTDAAIRRGEQVPIIDLGPLDDVKAKEISLVDNGRYGVDDSLKLAELLGTLGDQDELSSFLPYSDAELTSIFSVSSIDIDDLSLPDDDDEEPVLPPSAPKVQTHQVMRFKIPLEDVDDVTHVIEEIMKEHGFTESDSLTNAGDALVYLCKQGEK